MPIHDPSGSGHVMSVQDSDPGIRCTVPAEFRIGQWGIGRTHPGAIRANEHLACLCILGR